MGAGASSVREIDLGVTTIVLGQALAAITFPDMFRLQDFHSQRAPKLGGLTSASWFGEFQNSDDEDEVYEPPPPSEYEHLFHVKLGDHTIYLDDISQSNAVGWTPLHACCHSPGTMGAAFKIIEEMQRRRADFNVKTIRGPGIFNSGWTVLHMATAYGLEAVVAMILNAGADVNCRNSFGFTPLFEACHRGFAGIAKLLIESKAQPNSLPTEEETNKCPLLCAPPQAPLAEAARFGFTSIVQLLLDSGADTNQTNLVGWTALHEASFYNHVKCVQLLLVHGADASIKTHKGILAWQLTQKQAVKDVIQEIGGSDAVPLSSEDGATAIETPQINGADHPATHSTPLRVHTHVPSSPNIQTYQLQEEATKTTPNKDSLLGDLPAIKPRKTAPVSNELDKILGGRAEPKMLSPESGKHQQRVTGEPVRPLKDIPQQFLCALSHQVMCEPVRTTYGQYFEKEVIQAWIQQHGHICPITAMPLAESDLIPDHQLRDQILGWQLGKPKRGITSPTADISKNNTPQAAVVGDDDLYTF